MAAYHQMGHHTANLVCEDGLALFKGAILSPVNETEQEICGQVAAMRAWRSTDDIVFDPQLYVPQSLRGKLHSWEYFPSTVDTADISQLTWWQPVTSAIAAAAVAVGADGVCSPAPLPRQFSDSYFDLIIRIGIALQAELGQHDVRALQTVVIDLREVSNTGRALEIASIVSRSKLRDIYIVFQTDTPPRREVFDGDGLRGGMLLIRALRNAGFQVTVGCSGSDMVLWKAAGATACATGKFFNLRRFSRSRWDEPSEGGANLPYWFEENLLAFLRESDLVRLRAKDRLSASNLTNPYAAEILEVLSYNYSRPPPEDPKPWVGLGWRQYMYWFAEMERRIDLGLRVEELLVLTENTWLQLQDEHFLTEEPRNDGSWIRPWRRALAEFQEPLR